MNKFGKSLSCNGQDIQRIQLNIKDDEIIRDLF